MRCMSVGYRGTAQFFYQGNDREKPQRRKLLTRAVGGKSFHSSTPLLSRAGVLEKLSSVLESPEEAVLTQTVANSSQGPGTQAQHT